MPNKKNGGRPTLLTPEIRDKLLQALKAGAYRETAAVYAGIGVRTLYRWLERGEADDESKVDSDYRQFWQASKGAEAEFELAALLRIEKAAADGAWRAAAWKLERKYPQRWGRKTRVETITLEMIDQYIANLEKELTALEAPTGT